MGLGTKLLQSALGGNKKNKKKPLFGEEGGLITFLMKDDSPKLGGDSSDKSEDPAARARREAMERIKANKPATPEPAPAPEKPKEEDKTKSFTVNIGGGTSASNVCTTAYTPSNPERDPKEEEQYINGVLGTIALCWYIAQADGTISSKESDYMRYVLSFARTNSRIPLKYRSSLTGELNGGNVSFNTVKQYLDKTDDATLISLVLRAQEVAEEDGITEREQTAYDAFRFYVEQKTGHRFDSLYSKSAPVDLTCPTCGAAMKMDVTLAFASCPFCGVTKVFDERRLGKAGEVRGEMEE